MLGGSGLVEKTIVALRVFQGMHIPSDSVTPFQSATLRHPFLKAWLSVSGIQSELLPDLNFRLEYKKPAPLEIRLDDGTLLLLYTWASPVHLAPFEVEARITEIAQLEVLPPSPKDLAFFDGIATSLQALLALASRSVFSSTPFYLKASFSPREVTPGKLRYPYGMVLRKQVYSSREAPSNPFLDMTFDATDLGADLVPSLKRWFQSKSLLGPVLELFTTATANLGFLEERFLGLTQALETFHRRTMAGTFMDQEIYDRDIFPILIGAIPNSLSKDHRTSLKSRLRFGNEVSLRRRIRELIRRHLASLQELFELTPAVGDEIVDMRNSLTHLPLGVSYESIDIPNLAFLASICSRLLEFLLLEVLGFSAEQVLNLVRTKQVYRRQARR
jgi:hypothetical protein